ncbi:MAG: methyltransferase domain-containing protein [Planctomycetes bacterium]|nr:methyltransferase domain-containing protein [Planctomycetota bacterium]
MSSPRGADAEPDRDQLARLARLRELFLAASAGESAGVADYWRDAGDLAAYDRYLGARIGWKWDAVLDELAERGAVGPVGTVVDWGCGTGVAGRRAAARLGAASVTLVDRSPLATAFARDALREEQPALDVAIATDDRALAPDLLLVSHVLDELRPTDEQRLCELIARSRAVLWVEAGTRAVGRRLAALRDRLLDTFEPVAPCPHAGPCSALRDRGDGREHWCHFFARPPATVFQDPGWARAGRELGIDLRALPYSFVALRRRGATAVMDRPSARLVGRPAIGAKVARFWVCTAAGLAEREVVKPREPALFRALRKAPEELRWPPAAPG